MLFFQNCGVAYMGLVVLIVLTVVIGAGALYVSQRPTVSRKEQDEIIRRE